MSEIFQILLTTISCSTHTKNKRYDLLCHNGQEFTLTLSGFLFLLCPNGIGIVQGTVQYDIGARHGIFADLQLYRRPFGSVVGMHHGFQLHLLVHVVRLCSLIVLGVGLQLPEDSFADGTVHEPTQETAAPNSFAFGATTGSAAGGVGVDAAAAVASGGGIRGRGYDDGAFVIRSGIRFCCFFIWLL